MTKFISCMDIPLKNLNIWTLLKSQVRGLLIHFVAWNFLNVCTDFNKGLIVPPQVTFACSTFQAVAQKMRDSKS